MRENGCNELIFKQIGIMNFRFIAQGLDNLQNFRKFTEYKDEGLCRNFWK